jgi:uncharacterized protein
LSASRRSGAISSSGQTDLIETPARQAATLEQTEHRPWPLPDGRWVMAQTWEDLLFAHWRAPADALRQLLPAGLELDLYEGEAWLAITPFRVTGLRARGLPPLPFISSFLELNARTYVTDGEKPEMRAEWSGGEVAYDCRRHDSKGRPAAFHARYRPNGEVLDPDSRSLAHFLTERYCLYTVDDTRLRRGEIHHPPWPLQAASAEIGENSMPPPGIAPADEDPLLHFSSRQDTLIWPLDDA